MIFRCTNATPERFIHLTPTPNGKMNTRCLKATEDGMEAVALRFFNVYGAGQRSDGAYAAVVPKFIELALAGKAATIFGDGLQARDFVHVSDVANAVLMMATQPWDGERACMSTTCAPNGMFPVGFDA